MRGSQGGILLSYYLSLNSNLSDDQLYNTLTLIQRHPYLIKKRVDPSFALGWIE